jgi:hypothetical protein
MLKFDINPLGLLFKKAFSLNLVTKRINQSTVGYMVKLNLDGEISDW